MKPVISSLEADRWASLFHRLPADLPAEKPLAMPLQAFGECPGRFTVPPTAPLDRKSVVEGKSVSVRVDLGGRRIITKKKKSTKTIRRRICNWSHVQPHITSQLK